MGKYYFDLFNDTVARDDEGREYPDVSAARQHAEKSVRELAAESIKTLSHLVLHHHIVIRQEDGGQIDIVKFGDVVRIEQ